MNLWTVGCADPRLTAPARSLWTSRGKRYAFPPPCPQVGGCPQASQHPATRQMNLISGKGETSSRLPAFSLFLPGSRPNNRYRRIHPFSLSRRRGANERVVQDPCDAFEMTRGRHAAVVLAGYGLAVAPFDLEAMRILAKPSSDIDTVLALFSRDKGAYVGYSSCDAPFYLLLTDCVRSLRLLVQVHPKLSEVKALFTRIGRSLPPDPGQLFMHGMAVVARLPGDAISTVGLFDPDPMSGSVTLYAGWQVDGAPCGAPPPIRSGRTPVL